MRKFKILKKAAVPFFLFIFIMLHTFTIDAAKPEVSENAAEEAADPALKLPGEMADGIYDADRFTFTFSGGTGRVQILCNQIEVREGAAWAEISFERSSHQGGKPGYDTVRVGDEEYSGDSTFVIPVQLNQNTSIVARTVSMSAPHWIEYVLYIDMTGHSQETDAPDIMGLTGGQELQLACAELVRVYSYDRGYFLLEIESYRQDPLKYLIIPEGQEAPAGLEKEYQLIQKPCESLYVSSVHALGLLCRAGLWNRVKLIGIAGEKLTEPEFGSRLQEMELAGGEEEFWGGSYDDWELRQMLKQHTDLIIEDPAILPEQMDAEQEEKYFRLSERAAQIDAVMLVDRSMEEQDPQAAKDWERIYRLILEEPSGTSLAEANTEESTWMLERTGEEPEIDGLECSGRMQLDFAKNFNVYYYTGGYKLIDIPDSGTFLIVPEGAEVPERTEEFTVLQAPVGQVYLAATSAMSLIDAIECMDRITLTGTDENGWNIQAPIDALKAGSMKFAGKYSEPDYELLVGSDCRLAIESTMILHSPEVKEMLEDIDIPVFTDRSSYEKTGLGRTEWIKAYGAMFDAEDLAFEKYNAQKQILIDMENCEETGKTIAYFSIGTDGSCVVRQPEDYIAAMIRDAGGIYIFDNMDSISNGDATADISMEEFYSRAVDADYLVYNGTITGSLDGKNALLDKSELFSDFKAFQEGKLWQVDSGLYQSTDKVAQLIRDFRIIMTDGDESQLTFLQRIE